MPDVAGNELSVFHTGAPVADSVSKAPVVPNGARRLTWFTPLPYIRLFAAIDVSPVPPAGTPSVPKVMGAAPPPPLSSGWPAVPATVGRLKLYVPAAACGWIVTTPLPLPASDTVPEDAPGTPITGVTVTEGTPAAFVFSTPPFTVARPVTLFAPLEYKMLPGEYVSAKAVVLYMLFVPFDLMI